MSLQAAFLDFYDFNRIRTNVTLDAIQALPNPQEILGWRPGIGRAHIAWQFMHVAITEELFATERIFGEPAAFGELIPRFKGGSVPDDQIPTLDEIRLVLQQSRDHLKQALSRLTEADLTRIPEAFKERGWTISTALRVLSWHEGHHQGQAHITLNLWKNRTGG